MSSKQFTAKIFRWLHQVNRDPELPLSAAKVAIRLSTDFNEAEGGMAWPSCSTIANAIGLSERHVLRIIHALEACGHLRVKWGKQGRGHSSQYWMLDREPGLLDGLKQTRDDLKQTPAPVFERTKTDISGKRKQTPDALKQTPEVVKQTPAPESLSIPIEDPSKGDSLSPRSARNTHAPPDVADAPRKTSKQEDAPRKTSKKESKKESKKGDARKKSSGTKAQAGADFDAFWAVYPRQIAQEPARREFAKAIKDGADPEVIIEAAKRYAVKERARIAREGRPDCTKYPGNWLRDRRWTDPPPDGATVDQEGNVVAVERQAPERREKTWEDVRRELLAEIGERRHG